MEAHLTNRGTIVWNARNLTYNVPEVPQEIGGIIGGDGSGARGKDIQPVPVPSRAAAPAAPTLDAPPFIRAFANKS